METLKVTGMTVDKLDCSNKEHLMSADLRGLTISNYVYMPSNPSLTTVQWGDVSNIAYIYMGYDTSLASFDCTNFTALQYLELSSCTSLATLSGLTHTALKTLNLQNCTGLGTTLDMSGMNNPGLALYLYDSSITKYVQNGGCLPGGSTNGFGEIKTVELSNLTPETRDDYFWNTEDGYEQYGEGTVLALDMFSGMETLKLTGMTVDKFYCSNKEHLTSADLRGLTISNYVYMPYNYSLTTVQWGDVSNIAYIYMSGDTSLASFDCTNFTALQYLDLSSCTSLATISGLTHTDLKTLSLQYCTGLGTTLDMSGMNFPSLDLYIYDSSITKYVQNGGCLPGGSTNGFGEIKTVELSNLTPETRDDYFWNAENGYSDYREGTILDLGLFSGMETLKVTGMTVDKLNCSSKEHLKSADLRGLKVTNYVYMPYNYSLTTVQWGDASDIAYLDMGSNSSLRSFDCTNFTALQYLELSSCTSLATLSGLPHTDMKRLNLERCTGLGTTLDMSGMNFPSLDLYLYDSSITKYVQNGGCLPGGSTNGFGAIKTVELSNLTPETRNEFFWNTEDGYSEYREGTILDLGLFSGMETLKVTGMTVERLDCYNKEYLTSADLRGLKVTNHVYMPYNYTLSAVQWGDVSDIAYLDMSSNSSLTSFDTSAFTAMQALYFNDCKLENLDVSSLAHLKVLNIYNNRIPFLNLESNTEMTDQYGLWEQYPEFKLVLLSANQVGIAMDEGFQVNKITTLQVNEANATPSTATVDGQLYFVVNNNASTANGLVDKSIYYEYETGYVNGGEVLKVTGTAKSVEKCRSFLTLSKDKIWPTYGGTATAPTVTRSEGYDGALTYTSSNTSVVTVNNTTGKLTVKKAGTAIITITGAETAYRQAPEPVTYTVTVKKASPVFTFAEPEIAIFIDEAMPQNALNKGVYDGTVTYASSNTAVATVNTSTGAVTIKGAGTTTITASGAATSNCNAPTSASYTLTVSKHTATITLSKTTVNATYGGSAAAPTVTVTDGYDGTLNYTSNKTGVVTVNKTTGKLTIKGAGTATITVSGTETNTWNKPANKTYTVKVAKASPVFSFEQPFVEINNVYNMAAAENALSTGIYDGQVVFSSSDESVATVDPATGDVSFHHSGTVTITATGAATSNCNAATASYQVEVSVEATGVNAIKANMEDGYWYTPAGIRVNNPRKGQIYIHNGKKVVYRPEAE